MEEIRRAFNAIATEYDAQREWVIPRLAEFYSAGVWAAGCANPAPEILDIGAGTGLFSALILQKFPGATLTLMDLSENMLSVARERFSGREKIRYVTADYRSADLLGPYDIVCSALSIHHLMHEDKRGLFHRIHDALAPGGMFVNADQASAESPELDESYRRYWDEFVARGPLREEEKREVLRRRDTLDNNARLSDQVAWLAKAGFSSVDVVYRNRTFVVFAAQKA